MYLIQKVHNTEKKIKYLQKTNRQTTRETNTKQQLKNIRETNYKTVF